MDALAAWADEGGDGFEELVAPARAWNRAVKRLDRDTTQHALLEANATFNALLAEAVRVATVVAAVN